MERALARSGARLRSSRLADNQRPVDDASALSASRSSASSPEDRGRDILLRLLEQITEFLERKNLMSSRVAASKEWRKSRSRRRSESSNNLFEVVIQVCEQRMRRLKRSTSKDFRGRVDEWGAQSPRMLVAEAIVQELVVSLMELRMKEKENAVMEQVESVEIMRQLHVHLQKDEELVRNKVCVGAGDEEQLEELQLMLRTDFLQEVAGDESPQKQQQADSAANNEASLQFAWETIEDQKKEIIRLRAENDDLKRLDRSAESVSALRASMFDDEPTKVINLLRSQLSSHHEKNLDILHDHIQRLERALQSATATSRKTRRGWDGSKSTFDSSRSSEKEDWSSHLSRSAVGTDFSRTQVPRKKCDECRKNSTTILTLRSEVKQLRAHAATDEDSLLQAEKNCGHLQRENSTLSNALLSAKQKQEELRQVILDMTQEKHQLQNLGDSEQRTSERSIRVLQEQLSALEDQKIHQKRKFDELVSKYDAEVCAKRFLGKQCADLQDSHNKLLQSTAELEKQVMNLDEVAQRCEKLVEERDTALKGLQTQLNVVERDGESRVAELQMKEALIEEMSTKLTNMQLCLDNLELEKHRATGETERLLQTLDESKRKNQRLEKGFEELKQGKELLASLQKVERGASALQLSDLQQAREQLKSLQLELSSSKSECNRLEQALAEAEMAGNAARKQHAQAEERMQNELETSKQKCLALEKQISDLQALQSNFETTKQDNCERIDNLNQELEESKTAILLWMNKYNAICEDKQKLEDEIQNLSEEQYSLQRAVEELQAEHDANALAQQATSDSELELREEISALKEQQRATEREHRVMDQERKALVKLVQTLQARPELQQRAFREMLMACQRGTERMLCDLSESVMGTLNKLDVVEGKYQTLKTRLASRIQAQNEAQQQSKWSSGKDCRPHNPASLQIVLQEEDFTSNANLSLDQLSTSQSRWLAPLDTMPSANDCCKQTNLQSREEDVLALSSLEELLKQWKWKYFAQCLVANSNKLAIDILSTQLKESSKSNEELKKTIRLFAWHKLKTKVENRQLLQLHHLNLVVVRRLSKALQSNQQVQCFTHWKHQIQVQNYRAKLRASANDPLRPSFSPTTTMALGNCIKLVRQFCEPTRKAEDERQKKSSQARGNDELTGYLVEINTKVASWRVAVDRKIAAYAERNNQVKSLQTRCSELKDLVGLNQRLIEEMERRAAGQQSVVEAAWDFATAYKALSPSARAQVFQSRDFLSASRGIVEGLNSLGLPRSANKLSQTVGERHNARAHKQPESSTSKKVNFLSASAAPGIFSRSSSRAVDAAEKPPKKLSDSNIELLEDAVGSLKGAVQKQKCLQRELKEKERSLTMTTKELEKRNMQFLMLRSFLQWKCASSNRDRRRRQLHAVTTRGLA